MRFRRLKINIQTSGGPFGTTLDFPNGLVVVWADNSMGKSTCVRAMLVALGLEAMLGTSLQELPLPPAMKTKLDSVTGGHAVIESEVFLELENSNGDRITVQRTIKGERDKNLITVFNGPALTSPKASFEAADYFVSRPGAATREHGFHKFLTSFLGWDLPEVQTYDGGEVPLYLQCIFPYFVVEQTRGWSTVLPPIPTQFRIRDVHKRAVEFLLDMDAHRVALRRQSLQTQKRKLEAQWTAQVVRANELADMTAGAIQSLPKQPISNWPPQVPPTLTVPEGSRWITITERAETGADSQRQLAQRPVPRVSEVTVSAEADLAEAEQAVHSKQTLLNRVMQALESEEQEVARVSERLTAIDEDIQRNKDVRTLKNLGSRRESLVEHGECPMCHQSLSDSLIPLPDQQSVMSLDENIEFLSEQRRAFGGLVANSQRIVSARRQQLRTLREELLRLREHVRRIRQTLVSDARAPSVAAVFARIELENRIKHDLAIAAQAANIFAAFSTLADQWRDLLAEMAKLPADDITAADKIKINAWNDLVRSQLKTYGFLSFDADQVDISDDTYRPEHEGFDLQTSISASDLIRTIWSYLNGMLELSRTNKTHHPGSLLLDEPRQQSTRDVSFAAFLRHASIAGESNQQVIFFTSEDRLRLEQHLLGIAHTFTAIEGRVLKAV